jgi:hypothetical protein
MEKVLYVHCGKWIMLPKAGKFTISYISNMKYKSQAAAVNRNGSEPENRRIDVLGFCCWSEMTKSRGPKEWGVACHFSGSFPVLLPYEEGHA